MHLQSLFEAGPSSWFFFYERSEKPFSFWLVLSPIIHLRYFSQEISVPLIAAQLLINALTKIWARKLNVIREKQVYDFNMSAPLVLKTVYIHWISLKHASPRILLPLQFLIRQSSQRCLLEGYRPSGISRITEGYRKENLPRIRLHVTSVKIM